MKDQRSTTSGKRAMVCLLIIFIHGYTFGQNLQRILADVDQEDFYAIQATMNAYYTENPSASGQKQWRRTEWFLQPRVYPEGRILNFAKENMREFLHMQKNLPPQRSTHGAWNFLGPDQITPGFGGVGSFGRLNCIEVDTANPDRIYVGASSGGIWKSENGGDDWINISPGIPSLSIADMVIDPDNTDLIYVLTGDAFNYQRSSIGILKSQDGGATWKATGFTLPLSEKTYGRKLIMHPANSNIQFAVTSKGVYRTTTGWQGSTKMTIGTNDFNFWDIEYKPGSTFILYVSQANSNTPIWWTDNGGSNWYGLAPSDPVLNIIDNAGGIQLAVTPDDPNCLYAFAGDGGPIGLLRSLNSGQPGSWTVQDTAITNLGTQAPYNMSLCVDPEDFEHVFLGQVWTKRSDTGGTPGSWQGPTNYVHADVHESYYWDGKIYHCNDGGLFVSSDNGLNFADKSEGLHITEIYRIAGTPQDQDLVYMGTQDNGSFKRTNSSNFLHVAGNDGMDCMINHSNSNVAYISYQYGDLQKSTNGGNSFSDVVFPDTLGGDWVAPFEMDPQNPDIFFAGLTTVYRTNNAGGSFTDLGKPPLAGSIIHMRQGVDDRDRLYVSSGNILGRTDDALVSSGPAAWDTIMNELPNLWIGGIEVNHNNTDSVYVCLQGYSDGNRVFVSGSGGNPGTWVNITGSLPNVPTNVIKYDPDGPANSLYLGTDIGVFYRNDDIGDWIYFSNGLSAICVLDLYIGENYIVAGTYGRGLWSSTKYSGCPFNLNVTGMDLTGYHARSSSNALTSYADYLPSFGTKVIYSSGDHIDMKPGFRISAPGLFYTQIAPCPTGFIELYQEDTPGQEFEETFTATPEYLSLLMQ